MPELTLEYLKLTDVVEWDRNPKDHEIGKIMLSIRRFGYRVPMIYNDRTGILIAGHGRLHALRQMRDRGEPVPDGIRDGEGDWLVPVIRGADLPPDEAAVFALVTNYLVGAGGWHGSELAQLQKEMLERGISISDVGWDQETINEIIQTHLNALADKDEDFDPADALGELPEPRIEQGEIWRLGDHRLMCGDSAKKADIDALLDGRIAHAMLTDPPYGIEHEGIPHDDPREAAILYFQVFALWPMKDAVSAAFQSPRLLTIWLDALQTAGHRFERLLWHYRSWGKTFPWRGWRMSSDAIVLSSVGSPAWPESTKSSLDTYIKDEPEPEWIARQHPTIKPLWICEDILAKLPIGMVVDPFLGTGTTLIAAEKLGRLCYAMEIAPKYCEVAIQRWESFTGREAEKIG